MADEDKVRLEKFNGKDFGYWKVQIEDYLYLKEYHYALTGKPKDMSDEKWSLIDRQALGTIRSSVTKNVGYNIVDAKTTADAFRVLSNMYEKPTTSNQVHLIRQFVNTMMKEGASVVGHINEFKSIISRLKSVNINFADDILALFLLSSLPDSWHGMVTAVSNSTGTTKLTLDRVRDLILSEDLMRQNSGETSDAALSTEGRGRNGDRNNRRGRNRGRSRSRQREPSRTRNDIVCWNCNESGHVRN